MKKSEIKLCKSDRIYYAVCNILAITCTIIVLIPMLHIVAASFSSASAVSAGKVFILPVEFSLEAYKRVFAYKSLWTGYRNTIIYTILGTTYSVVITLLAAYPLSRRDLFGRKQIMLYFTITMFFGGGLIPSYLLVKSLGMLDTIFAVIIPTAFSTYNMIVARTYIETNISAELVEAARIDGADDFKIFSKIVLPLSKNIIAVLALWFAVGIWNSYFSALIYINDNELYPLQIYLRDILIQNQGAADLINLSPEEMEAAAQLAHIKKLMKYAVIVVSTLPVMCFYPFVQKYFVKGVMIGSVKG